MSAPIVRTRGLTRRFGDFTAVDALDLCVPQGSIFAFLGGNGSGKSTTIRMLIGLLTPTEGEIEVDGVDVIREPRRVRDRVGYMGQRVSLYASLTLRENVEFYAGLQGLDGRALEERWGALRARFDLVEAESERPEDLPAGLRQRAGLALAMLHRPRLLFLDEPTAGVDVLSRALFWDRIREQAAAGVTVFVTTHFLEEADQCDRVSFIDAGRLVVDATPDELRARFSVGHRLRIEGNGHDPRALRTRLLGLGLEPEPGADGLCFRATTLPTERLEAIARALGPEHGDRIRIEPVPMNEVFRRLMHEEAAARGEAS